jgi:predicted alpha-1,2-mannosidase
MMCGRAKDGSWDPNFNPVRWAFDFTEGTPLHYTWSVFHDIPGLCDAMGGAKAMEARLDSVFAMPPTYDGSFWKGGTTHEIREMVVAGFGQYAHGNQPIQHMIYLYDYVDAPAKARYWTRQAMDRLYAARPDGYCGDEDNGQTSAWFVWSAMGMYPVCPASGEFALGMPLFDKVDVTFPGGRTLSISVAGNSSGTPGHTFNGNRETKPFVSRQHLSAGGKLVFLP